MINQKLSAEKFINELIARNINCDAGYTMLDAALLLTVNAHTELGKTDYIEIIYGDRSISKSCLDKPFKRLIESGLIDTIDNNGARTNRGESRVHYIISRDGEKLLKRCAL